MINNLSQLYAEHTGKEYDKWSSYISTYDEVLGSYRQKAISLLEIGVQNGGSLEIWSKYFPYANRIIGCDVDERCKCLEYEDPRISIVIGDANSVEVEHTILDNSPFFSFVIDDGSHTSSDIIKSFVRYFPHIEPGGLYIIEDLHASYWADFEGGLYNPFSAISFIKRLADVINQEHWRNGLNTGEYLSGIFEYYGISPKDLDLHRIHRIDFFNSLCVIYCLDPSVNTLGRRLIKGTEACVTGLQASLNNTSMSDQEFQTENDSDQDVMTLIAQKELKEQQIVSLHAENAKSHLVISELTEVVTTKDKEILNLTAIISESNRNISELKQLISRNNEEILHLNKKIAESNENVPGLKQSLIRKDEAILDLNAKITESNKKIFGLKQLLTRKDEEILGLNEKIAESSKNLSAVNQLLAEKEENTIECSIKVCQLQKDIDALNGEINRYVTSKSWRFTRPFRKIVEAFRRLTL